MAGTFFGPVHPGLLDLFFVHGPLPVNNISGKLFPLDFCTESLSEQGAYNRIYDEVLVDQKFQGVTQELLGNIEAVPHTDVVGLVQQIIPLHYVKQRIEGNILLSTQYMN